MSRPKAVPLHHQQEKLALLAARYGWQTNSDWCAALNIQSVSTVAAWKDGGGISDQFKQAIVSYLRSHRVDIQVYEFIAQDYEEFGCDIGLDSGDIESIVRVSILNSAGGANFVRAVDVDPISLSILGEYVGVYLCHASDDVLQHAIAIERFSIERGSGARDLIIRQKNNFVTQRSEFGPAIFKDDRLLAQISYSNPSYTDSVYYLMSVLVSESSRIFYGLYTDITSIPVREIFSTKIILFSWGGTASTPDRAFEGDELYSLMLPLVQNTLTQRARLVVEPPQYDFRAEILDAVRKGRLALERMAL